MKETKRLMSFVRRAVDDYGMIADGNRVAVGVSGGKDSLALLSALSILRRFYPKRFELVAISIDPSGGTDLSELERFFAELGVEYRIVRTDIFRIVFDIRKEENPCSLCAKLRRGALGDAATAAGCNVLALGHHFDDAVETFMLNLFFEGRMGCFSPVTELSRSGLRLIRPLIYMPEKDVRYFADKNSLPIVAPVCAADGKTEREEMKKLLAELEREHKGIKHRVFTAMQKAGLDGF